MLSIRYYDSFRFLKIAIWKLRNHDMTMSIPFPTEVALSAQLAALLEVSGWPKPGNVHRTADFPDTTFEEFLAGSVALGPAVEEAVRRGYKKGKEGKIEQIGIGELIKKAVKNVKRWHKGGNTHLGISFLFIPVAASVGLLKSREAEINHNNIKEAFKQIVRATTPEDAIHGYEAILIASSAALGRLKSVRAPDLSANDFKERILKEGVTLFDTMKISSEWDNISKEWVTGLEISVKTGLRTFLSTYSETKNVNIATVHTFLTILAKYPDTFIARKIGVEFEEDIKKAVSIGMKIAKEISREAKEILEIGGMTTEEGRKRILELDNNLRERDLNPGTTADITANSIFLAILHGFRP